MWPCIYIKYTLPRSGRQANVAWGRSPSVVLPQGRRGITDYSPKVAIWLQIHPAAPDRPCAVHRDCRPRSLKTRLDSVTAAIVSPPTSDVRLTNRNFQTRVPARVGP